MEGVLPYLVMLVFVRKFRERGILLSFYCEFSGTGVDYFRYCSNKILVLCYLGDLSLRQLVLTMLCFTPNKNISGVCS